MFLIVILWQSLLNDSLTTCPNPGTMMMWLSSCCVNLSFFITCWWLQGWNELRPHEEMLVIVYCQVPLPSPVDLRWNSCFPGCLGNTKEKWLYAQHKNTQKVFFLSLELISYSNNSEKRIYLINIKQQCRDNKKDTNKQVHLSSQILNIFCSELYKVFWPLDRSSRKSN